MLFGCLKSTIVVIIATINSDNDDNDYGIANNDSDIDDDEDEEDDNNEIDAYNYLSDEVRSCLKRCLNNNDYDNNENE